MPPTVYLETSVISYLTARPSRELVVAAHQQITAEHGADYLVTWNCRHIASARSRPLIEWALRARGYHPPILCTPEELMDA